MRYDEMVNSYYQWLLDTIHIKEYGHYERILHHLFTRKFYWLVPMDRNRYYDGLSLRDDFAAEFGLPMFFWRRYLPDECTVLEMMVGLARAAEERLMWDPSLDDRTHVWFWIMMNKSGLDNLTDERYSEAEADSIVNRILNRSFSPDGTGSLFGRLNHDGDLRQVEWWYLMNYYFMEYYEF